MGTSSFRYSGQNLEGYTDIHSDRESWLSSVSLTVSSLVRAYGIFHLDFLSSFLIDLPASIGLLEKSRHIFAMKKRVTFPTTEYIVYHLLTILSILAKGILWKADQLAFTPKAFHSE